jgi:hypothetical protein
VSNSSPVLSASWSIGLRLVRAREPLLTLGLAAVRLRDHDSSYRLCGAGGSSDAAMSNRAIRNAKDQKPAAHPDWSNAGTAWQVKSAEAPQHPKPCKTRRTEQTLSGWRPKCHWGSRMLKRLVGTKGSHRSMSKRVSPGQRQLPFLLIVASIKSQMNGIR